VGSSGWTIKNTGNSLLNTSRPDGARATSLSPFFWRGATRDFWRPDGTANELADKPLKKELILQHLSPVQTAMNLVRTLIVEWLFSFHFAHEH
jgi:hypothetical protein